MAQPEIRVTGLRELRKALKDLEGDDTWKQELKAAGKDSAGVVVVEGRSLAARGGVTLAGTSANMGSRAIGSIRALAGQTRATVAGGSASIPYFGGWNFGSSGANRQFPRRKSPDYSLYSAVENKRDEVISVYTEHVDRITGERFR